MDEIVDYTKEDFSQKYKDAPFDVIVDSIGGAAALQRMHAAECTCIVQDHCCVCVLNAAQKPRTSQSARGSLTRPALSCNVASGSLQQLPCDALRSSL